VVADPQRRQIVDAIAHHRVIPEIALLAVALLIGGGEVGQGRHLAFYGFGGLRFRGAGTGIAILG